MRNRKLIRSHFSEEFIEIVLMKHFTANVTVTLRSSILDVQGKTVEHALHSLHMPALSDVRIGKHIQLTVTAPDADTAREEVDDACKKLLTNPVMEDYSIYLTEVVAAEKA